MAVLCGTHAHYEGEVTINNQPVIIRSPRDAKQLGIHWCSRRWTWRWCRA
ncbi:hypothetical protein M3O75_03995 [Klebsiella pneumoniae]|nr:hypothetical protein [Klebsiella pneumoniae]